MWIKMWIWISIFRLVSSIRGRTSWEVKLCLRILSLFIIREYKKKGELGVPQNLETNSKNQRQKDQPIILRYNSQPNRTNFKKESY